MEKQDILIRLLKEGHISDEEFKLLWNDQNVNQNVWPHTTLKPQFNEPPFIHLYDPTQGPFYTTSTD